MGITDDFKKELPRLYPRLHRAMSAYLAGSDLDPEDITQEAFLKAYRSVGKFKGESGFYTWIYSIARNLCIDHFRKQKNEPDKSSIPVDEFEIESDEFKSADKREEILLLRKAIAQLPELLRTVVIMKTVDGLTYPEISEILDVNEQTIKNRMFRARKELAGILKKMGVDQI
ncbi:RNA polymerase sigma factor [Rhodohalobacter halophilus]|uniref:RNA polymerase sigma factor n=1 Tax=Rhodohalobacter halophilus TaxID=1812810 RepID=UPI00083F53BF|nr:RNA polymerase sigma factor [Rhodohalobacter halophilus]